jgi:hypothetical protein
MKNSDRSQPSFFRRFFYGFAVTSLATIVLSLAFAPRTRDIVVVRTTLSCTGSKLEPAKLWNTLVTVDAVVETADEASLFHASVSSERRRDYLKSNFRMQTRPGETPDTSLAMLHIQHPHGDRAEQFLTLLVDRIMAAGKELHLQQSVAGRPFEDTETLHVIHRSTDKFVDGPAGIRRASLVLFSPNQQTSDSIDAAQSNGDAENALEEARHQLKVNRKRYRGLVDAAGRDSTVAMNMSYEVDRLEAIVQNLEFAVQNNETFETEIAENGTSSPFQFVATQAESTGTDEPAADSGELLFEIVQAAEIVKTIPGGVSAGSLLSILPFAGGFGILAGWCVTRKLPIRVIADRRDIEHAIEIPILGSVFPTRNKVTIKKSNPISFLGKSIVRIGELGLFLFVGFVVFCAATDNSFIQNFLKNPFGTYAASLDYHVFSSRTKTSTQEETLADPAETSPADAAGEPLARFR